MHLSARLLSYCFFYHRRTVMKTACKQYFLPCKYIIPSLSTNSGKQIVIRKCTFFPISFLLKNSLASHMYGMSYRGRSLCCCNCLRVTLALSSSSFWVILNASKCKYTTHTMKYYKTRQMHCNIGILASRQADWECQCVLELAYNMICTASITHTKISPFTPLARLTQLVNKM